MISVGQERFDDDDYWVRYDLQAGVSSVRTLNPLWINWWWYCIDMAMEFMCWYADLVMNLAWSSIVYDDMIRCLIVFMYHDVSMFCYPILLSMIWTLVPIKVWTENADEPELFSNKVMMKLASLNWLCSYMMFCNNFEHNSKLRLVDWWQFGNFLAYMTC